MAQANSETSTSGTVIERGEVLMKSPGQPGEGLVHDLAPSGQATIRAAAAFRITRRQANGVLAGGSAMSPESALGLEALPGPAADHGPMLQVAHDLARIRQRASEVITGLRRSHPA